MYNKNKERQKEQIKKWRKNNPNYSKKYYNEHEGKQIFYNMQKKKEDYNNSLNNWKLRTFEDKIDYSYIAGFFDGEGNLNVSFLKPKTYQLTIRIYSTNREILEKINDFVKIGHIYKKNRKEKRDLSICYEFVIFKKKDCLSFLKNIFPYSNIKKEQIMYLLNNFYFIKNNNNINFDLDKFRSFIKRKNVKRKYHTYK